MEVGNIVQLTMQSAVSSRVTQLINRAIRDAEEEAEWDAWLLSMSRPTNMSVDEFSKKFDRLLESAPWGVGRSGLRWLFDEGFISFEGFINWQPNSADNHT